MLGEVVLVKGACSRCQWPIGKIAKLERSRDGGIRVALVPDSHTGKTYRRTVQCLYPLELSRAFGGGSVVKV